MIRVTSSPVMRVFLKAALTFVVSFVATVPPCSAQVGTSPSANLAGSYHWSRWLAADGGNDRWYGFREDWTMRMNYAQATALAETTGCPLVRFNDDVEMAHLLDPMHWNYFEVWIGDSLDAAGNASSIDWHGTIASRQPDYTLGAAAFVSATNPFESAPGIVNTNAPFRASVGATATIGFDFVSFTSATFLWRFHGEPLSRETNATLNLPILSTSQAGVYDLIVRNFYGAATSPPVNMTVTIPAPMPLKMWPAANDYLRMDFVIPEDVDRMDLEYTLDFKTWTATTLPKTHGYFQHYEKMDMNAPRRYYRLRRYP
jgi:hypothetical protein